MSSPAPAIAAVQCKPVYQALPRKDFAVSTGTKSARGDVFVNSAPQDPPSEQTDRYPAQFFLQLFGRRPMLNATNPHICIRLLLSRIFARNRPTFEVN
jgi:hypothetical protein